VDDVEAYSEFLPWCSKSTVLSRNNDEVRASLELSKGGFEKKPIYNMQPNPKKLDD